MNLAQFVFIMGHEISHAIYHPTVQDALNKFAEGVFAIRQNPGLQDYTGLLLAKQNINASDEAVAHINGWNAMVEFLRTGNPNLNLSYAMQFGGSFASAVVGDMTNNLKINGDLSISPSAQNIGSVVLSYFKNPSTVFAGNVTYSEFYGISDLAYIAKIASGERIVVDLTKLGILPAHIASSKLPNLPVDMRLDIFDPTTHEDHLFEKVVDGVIYTHTTSTITPEGTLYENKKFDVNGNEIGSGKQWINNDGSRGEEYYSADGYSEKRIVDAEGNITDIKLKSNGECDWYYDDVDGIDKGAHRASDGLWSGSTRDPSGVFTKTTQFQDGSEYTEISFPDHNESKLVKTDGTMVWNKDTDSMQLSLDLQTNGNMFVKIDYPFISYHTDMVVNMSGGIELTTYSPNAVATVTGNMYGEIHVLLIQYQEGTSNVQRTEYDFNDGIALDFSLEYVGLQNKLQFPIDITGLFIS